tara:strand:- start:1076 stop:1375 length:300 start_codon:yes stop_codon:yes gene_type:complete
MVIYVLDIVDQCVTYEDGVRVQSCIVNILSQGGDATVSFAGVNAVPSSFVKGAFVDLLNRYSIGFIRTHLRVTDSTRQINAMIKDRFDYAVSHPIRAYA